MRKLGINEDKVLNILKKRKDGVTITDIVTFSKMSRSTVRVALAMLEGLDLVEIRNIGMAKLYRVKGV